MERTAGYYFALSWRYSLSGVFATSLSLFNFMTGTSKILSYKVEVTSATTTGATVVL